MGYAISDKSRALFRIADYAAIIYSLSQKLLASGMGHGGSRNGSGMRAGVKFDVTSLIYERAKNDLFDAIATARAADFQDIPFFLSHDALLQVQKRLFAKKLFTEKNKDILILANHQVFICNVEDLLDRATNHNYDSFQSKKGYIGDRIDIILKLKSVMAEYAASQRSLESDVPLAPSTENIASIIQLARQEREQNAVKDALKKCGWLLQKADWYFDIASLKDGSGKMLDESAAVFLWVQDGRVSLQADRMRWQGHLIKQNHTIARSLDTAILAKFRVDELQEQIKAGRSLLHVRLNHGVLNWDFSPRPSMAKPTVVIMGDSTGRHIAAAAM